MNDLISVVICTYESSLKSTLRTIYSVIRQKDVTYEIVISDDGSSMDYKTAYEAFFHKYGFSNYKIIKNKENHGTVANLYIAACAASGEYMYCLAPGDFFYNENSLKTIYDFVIDKGCSFAFADSRYYKLIDGKVRLYPNYYPCFPGLFNNRRAGTTLQLSSLFISGNPIGASYLRNRTEFVEYLSSIKNRIIYTEDKPTSSLHLLSGKKILYLNQPILWYEYGGGISTSKNSYFQKLLKEDEKNMDEYLHGKFPKSRVIRGKYTKSILGRLKYPDVCIIGVVLLILTKINLFLKRVPESDVKELKRILKMKEG